MKERKNLIIALIAVIAVGAMICVGLTISARDNKEEKHFLSGYTADKISGISVTGAVEFFFVRTAEGWGCAQENAFPTDAGKVSVLAAEIASRRIDKVAAAEQWEEYGLDTPLLTLKIMSGNDESICVIGSYNEMTDVYYVGLDGAHGVYTVAGSFVENLLQGKNQYAQMPDMTVDGEVTALSVTREGKTFTLRRFNEDSPQIWRTGYDWVIESDCGALPVENQSVQAILSAVSGIRDIICYDYAPAAEVVSACGLDNGTIVNVETNSSRLTIELGGLADTGGRYIRIFGESMICVAPAETVEKLEFSPGDIAVINPLLGVERDSVESITVETESGEFTLHGDDNGVEAVLALSSDAYSVEAENYRLPAQISIKVQRSTEIFPSIELELVRFNELLWVARTWGIGGCFVTDMDVQNMLAAVE